MSTNVREVAMAQLRPSHTASQIQRRKSFEVPALKELAESIKSNGLLQPIVVRPLSTEDGVAFPERFYEIVAGERRFMAAEMAGLERIVANVLELTDEQVIEVQLIENLQRQDVHPMHEAEGYAELVKKYGHRVEDLHIKIGKSKGYVYGRMKLLALSKACRTAFYENTISASIAEKLARIPNEKLQDEALKAIVGHWGGVMSFREAAKHIQEHYMLRLAEAPFPTEDDLAGAGPCGKCMKRTGNQPELFGDVKGKDVCTDTVCFSAKTVAYGQRQLEQARQAGTPVISGAAAKKLLGNNSDFPDWRELGGYVRLDGKVHNGGTRDIDVKKAAKGAEVTLVQLPAGRVIEVVKASAVMKESKAAKRTADPYTQAAKKAAIETKFRRAVYMALRTKLKRPTDLELAHGCYNALDSDRQQMVWQVRGVEIKKTSYNVFDRTKHEKMIDALPKKDLDLFMTDCLHVGELRSNAYDSVSSKGLLELARKHKVNVAGIRAAIAPKKKPAKKAAKARKHK